MGASNSKQNIEALEKVQEPLVQKELSPLEKAELKLEEAIKKSLYNLTLSKLELTDEDMSILAPKIPIIITHINLTGNKLTKIPKFHKEIISLNFNYNNITEIDILSPKIKTLHIFNNKLTKMTDLSKYFMLNNLDFGNNQIEKFDKFPKYLNYLVLSNNNLTKIPDLTGITELVGPGVFGSSIYLNFSNNLIEKIENLPKVNKIELDLYNNRIKEVNSIPKNIYQINLLKNPITDNLIHKVNENNIEFHTYENETFHTLTIPKGTVLFRNSKSLDNGFRDTFIGYFKKNKYIVSPDHESYFFLSPFSITYGLTSIIYVLTEDLKVILGVNPSNDTSKSQINERYGQECKTKEYKSKITNNFNDLCLKDDFVKKYPKILGWFAMDSEMGMSIKHLENKNFLKYKDYLSYYENKDKDMDRPELAIYPFRERSLVDVETDALTFDINSVINNYDKYNYKPIMIIDDNRDFKNYKKIIDKLLSKKGYKDESGTYHMIRDEIDGTYKIKEYM